MSLKRRDAAASAISNCKNFKNEKIVRFLEVLLEWTGPGSEYSLCWASQEKFAQALRLKVWNGQNKTIRRILTALEEAGAIKRRLLFTNEAQREFEQKKGWRLDLKYCKYQRNFLQINWFHPVWSGDLSGISISTKTRKKSRRVPKSTQDQKTGRFRHGVDQGWDMDEETPPVKLTGIPGIAIKTCSPPVNLTDDVSSLKEAQEEEEAKTNSESSVQNHVASQASRPDFESLDSEDVEAPLEKRQDSQSESDQPANAGMANSEQKEAGEAVLAQRPEPPNWRRKRTKAPTAPDSIKHRGRWADALASDLAKREAERKQKQRVLMETYG